MFKPFAYIVMAIWATVLLTGCESKPASPVGGPRTDASPTVVDDTPERISIDGLPAADDKLPPLDKGRVKVPVPAGWKVLSKKKGYLARFFHTVRSNPPRINVTVVDPPQNDFPTATEENVDWLRDVVQEHIDGKLVEGEKLVDSYRTIVFGNKPWVRCVRGGKLGNIGIERQILVTIADGRMYTVELMVIAHTLKKHRDSGYAVAAAMQFLGDESDKPSIESTGELDDDQ